MLVVDAPFASAMLTLTVAVAVAGVLPFPLPPTVAPALPPPPPHAAISAANHKPHRILISCFMTLESSF